MIKQETPPNISAIPNVSSQWATHTTFKRHPLPSNALAFSLTLILSCAQD